MLNISVICYQNVFSNMMVAELSKYDPVPAVNMMQCGFFACLSLQ